MAEAPVAVAMCADIVMERPLYTAMFSVLSNTRRFVRFYLFNDGFRRDELEQLERTLRRLYDNFSIAFIEKSAESLTWRKLHGNAYTFIKFFIPEAVDEKRILYLDVDMIIDLDVGELYDEDLGGKVLGASAVGEIAWALVRDCFQAVGLRADALAFNAGMLLIDAERWRATNVTERCIAFANRHSAELRSADQAVFNVVLNDDFKPLHDRYNVLLDPRLAPLRERTPSIYHFVGSPKPWDPGGKWLHPNHSIYAETERRLGPLRLRRSFRKARLQCARCFFISKRYWAALKSSLRARGRQPG